MKKLLILLSFSMIALLNWSQVSNACFSSRNDISIRKTFSQSRGIVKGDFDSDGVLDIVSSNYVASLAPINRFSFQKGLGNGKFGPSVGYGSAGLQTQDIRSADFNNDGKQDIAYINQTGIYIWHGQGNGVFDSITMLTFASGKYMAVGDFNEDGAIDIVATSANSQFTLFEGTLGNPTLFTSTPFSITGSIQNMEVADMNGDNHLDVVSYTGNGVYVSRNNNGSLGNFFTGANVSSGGTGQTDLTLCDLDNDGDIDVVTTNRSSHNISVLKNNGSGTLGTATLYATELAPDGIDNFDINQDGFKDIVVANASSSTISIFFGGAGGILSLHQTTQAPGNPKGVVIGQFTADSYADIVTCQTSGVYFNSFVGNASYNYLQTNLFDIAASPSSAFASDFNADGNQDVAITHSTLNTVQIYLGNGAGGFTTGATLATGTTPFYITGADLNNNGTMDLVVVNNGSANISVFYGTGSGTFSTAANYSVGTTPVQAKIGHLNGDAFADIVVSNSGSTNFSALIASGATSFNAAVNYTTNTTPYAILITDYDLDGFNDVVVGHNTTGVTPFLLKFKGDGSGSFIANGNIGVTAMSGTFPLTTQLESADFDGDGDSDIVVGRSGEVGKIVVPTNTSNTAAAITTSIISSSTAAGVSGSVVGLKLVDINNDGKLDVVAVLNNAGGVSTGALAAGVATNFGMDASYVITPPSFGFASETDAAGMAVADFNNDGKIDVIIPNKGSSSFTLHLNTTPVITAGGPTTFCSGNSVTLTSTPATFWYDWDPNNETTPAISATASGSYYVTTSSSWSDWCEAKSDTITVTVTPGPTAPTVTPGGPTTFCSGGSVVLTSSQASGNEWYKDGVLISGATNQNYTATTPGVYTVAYTSGGCTSPQSAGITVTASQNPVITADGPTTFCTGGSVTLTSSVTTNLLWSNGATTPSITVSTGGNYSVQNIVGGCPTLTSNTITVTVAASLSTPTISPAGPITLCPSGTAILTSSSPTNNIWSTGATTQSITVSSAGSYFVHLDNGSCSSPNSTPVIVTMGSTPAAPIITPGGPTTFCAGGSVTLTSSAGNSYLWSTGATTQSINVTTAGNYTVQVTNPAGCQSAPSSPTTVTVNALPPAPTITPGGATTFCAGGSVTLTSSTGNSYLWSTGETSASINVPASGSYTVQITDANSCQSAASTPTAVTVNALPATPTITSGGATTFCAGGSVTLTSSTGNSYLWSTGETSASINVSASGSYTVQITDANGCQSAISTPTVVTVNALPATPTITSGGATTFCAGGSVTLTSSTGNSYLWSTGETSASINVSASGSYTVQITDANSCQSAASTPTAVTVNALPAAPIITPGGSTAICAGGSVTLTSSTGNSYLWSTGETSASINVSASGSYTVQITDANSCQSAASTPTAVTVNALPATPTITSGGATTFCAGGSVTLTSSTGNSYLWSTGETSASINVSTSGSYTVQITDANGCQSATSTPTAVTVNALPATPTITPGGATTFCAGGSVTLTSSTGNSYLWSTGETSASINVSTSGSYTVQITDANGCQSTTSTPTAVTVNALPAAPIITPSGSTNFCLGNSIDLTSSAGTSYLWSTGETTQSITVTTSGSYTVQVTNTEGCLSPSSSATNVVVNPLPSTPTASAGGPTTFCAGGSVVLTSSSSNNNVWSTGETTQSITVTTSGNYSVQRENGSGCLSIASNVISVTVNPLPAAPTITPGGSTTICAGASVTLTSSTGTGYLWSTGETTSSITVTAAGSYSVQITDANGCTSPMSALTTVNVTPLPVVPVITASGATTFCDGGSVVLTSSAASGNVWSTGETTQSITVTTSGTYTVEEIALGCSSGLSAAETVTVNPNPPVPTITPASATTFCDGGSVILTSSAASGNVWSTSETTQAITVTTSGSYSVDVTNGFGCTTSSASPITVTVNPIPAVPSITAGGTTVFCDGGSVVLTSSAATNNLWSTGETTQSITVTTSGSYSVEVIESGCTSGLSASETVTVNPNPTVPVITPSSATTFCDGGSVILTSSATSGNVWSTGETTQSITVTTSGSYSVEVTNGFGCTANSAATTVTVNPIPAVPTITASGPTTFCSAGGSVVLTSSAATGNLWSTGETTQSITVTTTGSYTVEQILLGCSSGASAPTDVLVNPTPATPTITAGGFTTFCLGGSVVLTSSASTGNVWSTGETTQSITVTTTGSYFVNVVDGPCTSAQSNTINVTANPIPGIPSITASGPTTFCSAGGSVVLTSSFLLGNVWSTGETTQSITVTTTGSYTVEHVLLGCSSGPSAPVDVLVNPTPATPVITAGGATTFCDGGSVVLTSTPGASYLWSTGETTQSITVTTSGSYSVTIIDGPCSSTASNVINVTVNPIPTVPVITAGGPTTFCSAGGSVVLTSSAATGNLWSTGETTQSITVTTTGSYTVEQILLGCSSGASAQTDVLVNPTPATPVITAGGVTTFCDGGSVVLTSTPGASYLWSTGETTQSITVTTSGSYSVTIIDGPCSSTASNVINVTVNLIPTVPVITAGGPTTFCSAGGSVVLTSSAATGNLWSTGETTQSITVTTTGSYTVEQILLGCSSGASAQTDVLVNPTPIAATITAGGATTFCAGGSVVLTSTPGASYLWSTGETTQSITVTTSGSYSVTIIDGPCSSVASNVINVTVNPIPVTPTITAGGPTTFCAGGSVVLTSSSTTGNTWSTGATTQSITVSASGTYTLNVTTLGCTSPNAVQTITVNPIPAAPSVTPGGPTTFCTGGSVVLTSSVSSGNTWSTTETTPSITVSASGSYTVTQTVLGCTSAASTPVNVVVNTIPSVPTITASGPTTFCAGGTVVLTSSSASNNFWSNGATTQSITVSSSGTFLVQVITNGCSSGTSAPKTVTVNPLPPAPTIVTGTTESICAGSSVTLTSSSTGGNLWSTGENTQSISVSAAGSYSVTVTDGNGCVSPASPSTVVTVNPIPAAPVISEGGPTSFCSGGSVALTSSYGSNNLWSSGSTANSITVSSNGTYTVTHTDANGCQSPASAPVTITVNAIPAAPVITASGPTSFCSGGSVTLTSSQALGNSWSTAALTQDITVNTGGVYSVIYIDGNGCASPSSAPILVTVFSNPPQPSITAGGATTICQGSFVTLTSSYTSGNTWSTGGVTQNINATTSGIYTVTYTNGNGCTSTSAPMNVTVIPVSAIPTISSSGSTTICDGSSVTLTSSDPNSTWSTGATTQSITVTTSGPYHVIGNQTGCPSQPSAPVVVTVNPTPATPVITPSGSTTICEGEELFLFTSGTGTNTWSTGYIGQVLEVTTSGNYWVSVQNVYGCTSSSTVVPVVVNPNPIVTVNPLQAVCSYVAPFTMSNGLPAGGTYTGDGITTNIFYPAAAGVGSSIVTYTYVDVNNCSAFAQTTIEVNDCAGIDEKELSYFSLFPNPNNGQFKVVANGTPIEHIILYDAQGKMVFNESYSGIFTLEFDLNAYSNGVYYIEINSGQEIQERIPLIINH